MATTPLRQPFDWPQPELSSGLAWRRVFAWSVISVAGLTLFAMLLHSFYLADDSAHSYAHVWYLSHQLFDHHHWPWHVSNLENGKAVMFPYGIVPWLPDALMRPLLGDWGVTFSMVLGTAGMVAAAALLCPALRRPEFLALFLVNPLLWNGVTQFQLATVWSFGLVFLGVWLFASHRSVLATGAYALGIAAHPMMGLLALASVCGYEWYATRAFPIRHAVVGAVAVVIAAPTIYLFLSTPTISDSSRWLVVTSTLDNLRRLSIVAAALALSAYAPMFRRRYAWFAGAGAVGTAALLAFLPPSGLWEWSTPQFQDYLAAHPVPPDAASYRVLTKNNYEDGMVEFLQAGAVLSSEFFSESIHRQSFSGADRYACFLATRHVGHVVLAGDYIRSYHTNEPRLLDELAGMGMAQREFSGSDGTLAYRVDVPRSLARGSARACGV